MKSLSALLAVHPKERAEYLREALESLVPQADYLAETVVVQDGVLGEALEDAIGEYRKTLRIRDVRLPYRSGLAHALNVGLKWCRGDWVMRCDSDDISLPDRARQQWSVIAEDKADLIGAQVEEIEPDSGKSLGVRRVPCSQEDILALLPFRNPFNHMTVCFRRELVLRVGGYPEGVYLREDYALWCRLVASGARVLNLPSVLVKARAGRSLVERRGGCRYALGELELQRFLVSLGLKSWGRGAVDGLLRAIVFLSPVPVRAMVYKRLLRDRT